MYKKQTKQIELDDKMDLASYLLKPVQRMGKYALLLQQLMKAVTSVQGPSLQNISEDIEELQRAEQMVRFQLRHGNDLLAMDSLRDCDVSLKLLFYFSLFANYYYLLILGECERTRSASAPKRVFGVARSWRQKNPTPSVPVRGVGTVRQSSSLSRSQKSRHLPVQEQY